MEVLKFPHPALFQKTKSVTVFGPELKVLLDSMWDTMKKSYGLGMAANQVGLDYSMFVMEGPTLERVYAINPSITLSSPNPANLKEGCLSAPDEILIRPDRKSWIKLVFQDETGKSHTRIFKDIHAVCVQHEMEHLEGKAFIDSPSLTKQKRRELAKKWGLA